LFVTAEVVESRVPRYRRVRDDVAALLAAGELAPGDLLPSEADLAARFGASRVTVRRALGLLKDAGLVASRQGFGWFVAGAPMQQALGVLAPIDEQIASAGRRPGRRLLSFGFRTAPREVEAALGTGSVLEISRLNLADDEPVGRNTAWVPDDLARGLSLDDVERESLHHLLPVDLGSATQRISAEGASPTDAELLQVPTGTPLLTFVRTTRDVTGRAVLASQAVYNPLRTEFTMELAPAPST
jgi:DNA-binding GntR family transcriptional regulator